MKYPIIKPKHVVTYYNITHTEELTDFEIMELFRPDAKVVVTDYTKKVVDGEVKHFWKVRAEWEVRL